MVWLAVDYTALYFGSEGHLKWGAPAPLVDYPVRPAGLLDVRVWALQLSGHDF